MLTSGRPLGVHPKGLKSIVPKHPEVLGRAVRRAPHREAFIPDLKPQVFRAGWQGYEST
jgi:hypothetical protein